MREIMLKDKVEKLLLDVKEEVNPIIKADEISHFIIEALRQNEISLYESYVMNFEVIKYLYLGYTQPAWCRNVRISTCLTFLNQVLLASVFDDMPAGDRLKQMALIIYKANKENRKHYIMDKYMLFLDAANDLHLLNELNEVREKYEFIDDNAGPFHTEVYPYDFFSPERILQEKEKGECYLRSKTLSDDVIKFISEV